MGKTEYFRPGEVRKLWTEWAAECEERDTEVASSEWASTDGGLLSGQSLAGTLATVLFAPSCDGVLTNTVVLDNGETLVRSRRVEVLHY